MLMVNQLKWHQLKCITVGVVRGWQGRQCPFPRKSQVNDHLTTLAESLGPHQGCSFLVSTCPQPSRVHLWQVQALPGLSRASPALSAAANEAPWERGLDSRSTQSPLDFLLQGSIPWELAPSRRDPVWRADSLWIQPLPHFSTNAFRMASVILQLNPG